MEVEGRRILEKNKAGGILGQIVHKKKSLRRKDRDVESNVLA